MDLKITSYNNFFALKGILNRDNVHIFQDEFRHIFDKTNMITISIEGLEFIDRYGVNAFAKLHSDSVLKNKKLAIIGLGCDDLYDHFKSEAA
jgi:anti-anti-sigma regulatory factor